MNRRQFLAFAIGAIVGFIVFRLRPEPEYHHYAHSFDGDSEYFYLNGKLQEKPITMAIYGCR